MSQHRIRRIVRPLVLMLVLALLSFGLADMSPLAAQDARPADTAEFQAAVAALAQKGAKIAYHPGTGRVSFMSAQPGKSIQQAAALPAAATRQDAAFRFLTAYGKAFGVTDVQQTLTATRVKELTKGRGLVRFQQTYRGIPVFGGELVVQLDSQNNILTANGEVLPDLRLSTTPTVAAVTAGETALNLASTLYGVPASELSASKPELWIYNPELVQSDVGGFSQLVWRTAVTSPTRLDINELVLVNATRGSVVLNFSQTPADRDRATYTANHNTSLPGTFLCAEADECTGDSHAFYAHDYAGDTYDFYNTILGRDSIDNNGMEIVSTVHFGFNYENAFWTGEPQNQMVYGDADGYPLADDVVGHELTHGVTQFESNLMYYYQSGAINESLSDVFGELVDQWNQKGNDSAAVKWLMGEDVLGLGALRNMKNPPQFGDPDKMTSTLYYTGAGDSGGVHTNSGVNNKAAYLMVDGGTFNGKTVGGLGIIKVAHIYYEVQTNMLTSGSDYADLAHDLVAACNNLTGLYGITVTDCVQVQNAVDAVEMSLQPVGTFNIDAPLCPNGWSFGTTLFLDDLESGATNWTFNPPVTADDPRWQIDSTYYGSYAHSGQHSLYADDYPDIAGVYDATMNSSVAIPQGAFLRFDHAYDLQMPNFDAGVVEYSTDGGTTWRTDSLFDFNGYDGTISTAGGNPLGGRQGFLGVSHGYIATRASLSTLAGQNVKFRFRLALNDSVFAAGWWVDDVHIYTCTPPAPANDNFAGVTPIPGLPFSEALNTQAATFEAGEQSPSCAPIIDNTIWYKYIAPQSNPVVFGTGGSDFDTAIAVWTGTIPGSLSEVACNDDAIGNTSQVTLNATASTTYYIQVGSNNGAPGGQLKFSAAVPPANDNFANAANFTNTLPVTMAGLTTGATLQAAEQLPSCGTGVGSTVWYKYFGGTQTTSITLSTTGSNFDTVVAVWTGTDLGSLSEQGCNDDSTDTTSKLTVSVTGGTTYYIQIGGKNGASGSKLSLLVEEQLGNDLFMRAFNISSLPYTHSQLTVGATTDANEPAPSCAVSSGASVWFSFYRPDTSTPVVFSTVGSDYNTVISVWNDGPLGMGQMLLACNDDIAPGSNLQSQVSMTIPSSNGGYVYYVRVSGYNGATGNLVFNAYLNNDNFAGAIDMGVLPFSASQSTLEATVETGEPLPDCPGLFGYVGKTIWYKYRAQSAGLVTFSTDGSQYDSNTPFDTVLTVFTGSSVSALTRVGCNDDDLTGTNVYPLTSLLSLNTVAGTTYYIRIGGYQSPGFQPDYGTAVLSVTLTTPNGAAPARNLVTTRTPTLTWNRVTWATYYEIQVDTNTAFAYPWSFTGSVSPEQLSVVTSALEDGTYYWRVRAMTLAVTGAYSAVDSFVVDAP